MNALELIKNEVTKYKTSSVLRMISKITWGGPEKFGLSERDSFFLKRRLHDLNLIAEYAILYSDESTEKNSFVTFDIVRRLLNCINDSLEEPQFSGEKKSKGKLSDDTIHSFLRRESQLQFRFQRDFHPELGRTLLIYNDLLKDDLLKKRRINYDQGFKEL